MQVLQEGERLLKQEAALAQLRDERLRQRMRVCGQAQGVRKRLKALDLQRRLRDFAPLELAPQRLVDLVVQRALLTEISIPKRAQASRRAKRSAFSKSNSVISASSSQTVFFISASNIWVFIYYTMASIALTANR